MIKIEIISVGKVKSPWIKEGIEHYTKLVSRHAEIRTIPVKEGDNAHCSQEKVLSEEAARLVKVLDPKSYKMILDSDGRSYSSGQLSKELDRLMMRFPRIQFVVGGAFGLDNSVKERGDMTLSLSPLTFPHELSLVLLLEQLYRAFTIVTGRKYHK